nr:uncharacterized protein LOC110365072 [Columba livia]
MSKNAKRASLETLFSSGVGKLRLAVGLDGLTGLFQLQRFGDAVIEAGLLWSQDLHWMILVGPLQARASWDEEEQEQSSFAWRVPLHAALQQWQLWAVAGVLLLLFGLCWWLRKRSQQPASSSKWGSSKREDDQEKQREKPTSALDAGRVSAKRLLDASESLMKTPELPVQLLRTSPKPSRNAYMLRPRPVRGLGNALDSLRPHEDDTVSRRHVPLKPTCWLCASATAPTGAARSTSPYQPKTIQKCLHAATEARQGAGQRLGQSASPRR